MGQDFILGSVASLFRTVVVGGAAYLGLILLIRLSGKRSLSKMNAFDWVVTVALGSGLATAVFSQTLTLTGALTGFATLLALQFVVTWLSAHIPKVERLVKAEPRLLLYGGELLHDAMCKERVTEREIYQAIRAAGISGVRDTQGVVLESDGSFTVLTAEDAEVSSLRFVTGIEQAERG